MANVLFVYENKIATVSLMEDFYKMMSGYESRIVVNFVPILRLKSSDMNGCNILCMIRPNHFAFADIAKKAKKAGIIVLFYLDDDLLNINSGNASMPWRKRALKEAAMYSDVIFSSSKYIAEFYGDMAGVSRRFSLDTAVPKEAIKRHIDGRNERIKIVYAAGAAHKIMFDEFVKPILKKLDDKYGEIISLTFMGVHPNIDRGALKMSIDFIQSLPLDEYRKRFEEENFDIGLAPLIANDFTKCKYFNKFIEYAMFGVVGIFSAVEPYTFVIKDKYNGLLSGNTPESWYHSLVDLIEDDGLIKACRENAYKMLLNDFDEKVIMDKVIDNIPELIEPYYNHNTVYGIELLRFKYSISRMKDYAYKVRYYFKKGGISEVFRVINRHFKLSSSLR